MTTKNNYRLPAEWEKHQSTILCWPHQKEDWPGKFTPIPWVYTEIVKNIVPGELVRIIVQSRKDEMKARKCLSRAHVALTQVQFIIKETDRGWMRDSSPAFVKKGKETTAIQFTFNGWAKYDNWKKDKFIPGVLAKKMQLNLVKAEYNCKGVVLEGGAIDSNGCGTLLTTEECLLDDKVQMRNPGFTKADYEKVFSEYLGIKNIIWLDKGIAGDDTHGHVDDLCRFVNRNTVLLCHEDNPDDENKEILAENFARLTDAKLEDGSKLNVVELPMPKPLHFEDLRLPASYANFYICNFAVLVPTFNDPNDRIALNIIQTCFPDREVIGIHAVDLVWGLGTIHCLTHEEPVQRSCEGARADHCRKVVSQQTLRSILTIMDERMSMMSEFTNVTIIKKANVYFDGKVTSRTVIFPDGSKKTLGIMAPGDYEFGTADKEIMEILDGSLDVLLPGSAEWTPIEGGESFEVPAQAKFKLKVKSVTDYCCSYLKQDQPWFPDVIPTQAEIHNRAVYSSMRRKSTKVAVSPGHAFAQSPQLWR